MALCSANGGSFLRNEWLKSPHKWLNSSAIINYLKKSGFLYNAIMFSDGEFLINLLNEVRDLLLQLRALFEGEIIVTTSGIYYKEFVPYLYDENLVDGSHIDMTLPFHVLDVTDGAQLYKDIMGVLFLAF